MKTSNTIWNALLYFTSPSDPKIKFSSILEKTSYCVHDSSLGWPSFWMPSRLIQQNPAVDIGATSPLKLAINTAQYGRTFQDRSHIIKLNQRLTYGVSGVMNIYNLNVRGKRGNIVQVQHNSPVWAVHMYHCHLYSVFLLFAPLFGGGGRQGGSELPASRTMHSLFPPPSTVIQAPLWGLAHERSSCEGIRNSGRLSRPLFRSFNNRCCSSAACTRNTKTEPARRLSGSCLCVLSYCKLLQNVANVFSHFSQLWSWPSRISPFSLRLPVPITPGFPPPCHLPPSFQHVFEHLVLACISWLIHMQELYRMYLLKAELSRSLFALTTLCLCYCFVRFTLLLNMTLFPTN